MCVSPGARSRAGGTKPQRNGPTAQRRQARPHTGDGEGRASVADTGCPHLKNIEFAFTAYDVWRSAEMSNGAWESIVFVSGLK